MIRVIIYLKNGRQSCFTGDWLIHGMSAQDICDRLNESEQVSGNIYLYEPYGKSLTKMYREKGIELKRFVI